MAEKKYFWIKLKTDFYDDDERIDFLMSQKNGSDYVILYQMLCLKTANKNGSLSYHIGEMLVPYEIDKIVRDCKYFNEDTVRVALELYKKLGLVYRENNGCLQIAGFDEIVGSECGSAKRVRAFRERQALQCNNSVTQDIDIRDKSIEKDIEKEIVSKKASKEKNYQSYDEIFDEFGVGDFEKEAYLNFIRHLLANGTVLINDRLQTIIVKLDELFGNDWHAKVKYINDAISKGYKRLPCEE